MSGGEMHFFFFLVIDTITQTLQSTVDVISIGYLSLLFKESVKTFFLISHQHVFCKHLPIYYLSVCSPWPELNTNLFLIN